MIVGLNDDLRFAVRLLRQQPTFTFAVVLMLALGIGVNATVFSWLETVVLDPLPGVSDSSSLVTVVQTDSANAVLPLVSYPDFSDLSGGATHTLAGLVGTRATTALLEHDGRTNWVSASVATANIFTVLGVRPEYGRTFDAEDDRGEGQHPVVVLGDACWRREFAGDVNVLGRAVRINQREFTVIGIAPASFRGVSGGSPVDVWAPLSMHDAVLNFGSYATRTFRWIHPLARLGPGVTMARAQAALTVLSAQLATANPDSNAGVAFRIFPLWQSPHGGQAAFLPVLRIVFVMAAGLLLIVVANVACLLLSRAARRQTETTIRLAIGAGRFRLARQFLAESVALALVGGAGGLLFAHWAVRLMPRLIPSVAVGFTYDFALSGRVAAFTAGLALLTAILFGAAPALVSTDVDVTRSLGTRARGLTGTVRHHRMLGALVVSEVALAVALLVGAGLCVRGFQQAARVDLGFVPDRVLYSSLNLVSNGYEAERAKAFDRALRQRLRSSPDVIEAALVSTAPLGPLRTFTGVVDVEGYAARAAENRTAPFVIVSPGYLSVMRIPLIAGRDFDDADDETRSHVAIVNDAMVRRYWPRTDPVGRRFRMAVGVAPIETFIVLGVCGTSRYDSLAEPPTPMVYVTYLQRPLASLFMNIVMRTRGVPELSIPSLRQELHALDPRVDALDPMPLTRYIEPAFMPVRIAATLLVFVGAAALLLAAVGLYAVMSYAASERTREIAIRLALGAQPGAAMRLVVLHGMTLVAVGIAFGLTVAMAMTRLLARFLFGISTTDAVTFTTITALLTAVGFVACLVPAHRSVRANLVEAMRVE